ncbi:MAG: addiction module protein [Candidatus Hydrogenedentota bacterium]
MVNLPLDKMTVEEKLQVMEEIWDDLSGRAESVPSPLWHGEVLAEREQTVERGRVRGVGSREIEDTG